jgi:hypothetical protein
VAGRRSPYLIDRRLADVIAAIQALASNEFYERRCEKWAGVIVGDEAAADYWRAVFDDHGEFFRSTGRDGREFYSLIARRALPHMEKATRNIIYDADYKERTAALEQAEKRATFGRPALPDTQIKMLIDIAISLHTKAVDAGRDWRWWLAPAAAFAASLLSALIGFVAA